MCVWIGRVTGDVGIENDEPSGGRGAVKVKHPPRMRAASGPSRRATSEWERTRLCLWAPPQPHRPNCSSPFSAITAQMQRAPRRNPTSLALPPAARAALDCPGPRAQAPTCCLHGRGKHRWFKTASLCRSGALGRWRMDFQQPDTVAHWLSLTCGSQTMDPARQACSFNAPC
jgi:hypothetical protein